MSEPRELVLLGKAERLLTEAGTINEVKDIRDKAQAAKSYALKAGLSKTIILHASVIKVQAERRLGEMLSQLPLADSAPGNQYTGKLDQSQNATGPIRLRDLGITKSDSSRAQQIASLPAASFARYVKDCVDAGQEPTTAALLRLARQQAVNDTVGPKDNSPNSFVRSLRKLIAEGRRFSTIYADPPWRYDNQATRAATNNHYPTMTLDEIRAEPVRDLAAKNCHLHLWATTSFLPAALALIEIWGFTYKSCFIWTKSTLGLGNYWRQAHELLLLGTIGNQPFLDKSQRSWIEAKRTGHSSKPEVVREIIEKVSPGPRLEMYGRNPPPNSDWTV